VSGGAYPYRDGYYDGWEAALTFFSEYINDILEALKRNATDPKLGGYSHFTYHAVVVDDADLHLLQLKPWCNDPNGNDKVPPRARRTLLLP